MYSTYCIDPGVWIGTITVLVNLLTNSKACRRPTMDESIEAALTRAGKGIVSRAKRSKDLVD